MDMSGNDHSEIEERNLRLIGDTTQLRRGRNLFAPQILLVAVAGCSSSSKADGFRPACTGYSGMVYV